MRKLVWGAALAAILPSAANAQTVDICDRTPSVRDAILSEIGQLYGYPAPRCAVVPAEQLAAIEELEPMHSLTSLQSDDLDGLIRLEELNLDHNQLAVLPKGVFDRLVRLRVLDLSHNQLATLPEGVFDDLARLRVLDLSFNHLVGLQADDPLFAKLTVLNALNLEGQTEPERSSRLLRTAVPLLVSTSNPMRQGFVRIYNRSATAGGVRIVAYDDAGMEASPVELWLGANRALNFNSSDLENGNSRKGIATGIGSGQGDWRLDVETALDVQVLAYVRSDGDFLTAVHDVLRPGADGRFVVPTFNPGSNRERVSKLRLINSGDSEANLIVEGVDDQGTASGSVRLVLPPGTSRTLSALELEEGAGGLTGSLSAGTGKWRLFITADQPIVAMSLLESATSGHLTNLSTLGATLN